MFCVGILIFWHIGFKTLNTKFSHTHICVTTNGYSNLAICTHIPEYISLKECLEHLTLCSRFRLAHAPFSLMKINFRYWTVELLGLWTIIYLSANFSFTKICRYCNQPIKFNLFPCIDFLYITNHNTPLYININIK